MASRREFNGRVRPPITGDRGVWGDLFASYAGGSGEVQREDDRDLVWGWIMDPDHQVSALLVEDAAGTPFGFAHYRPFARPLAANVGLYLEDLYVAPSHRGSGAVDALLAELGWIARDHGWSVVRWITADDNYRARTVYDRVARRTPWVTYDMDPNR